MEILLDDVSVSFSTRSRSLTAVVAMTLRCSPGTMTVLRGRSGCGKSTVLKLAFGTLSPCRGRVEWGGVDIATLAERERQQIRFDQFSFVDQEFSLIPHLTARHNVQLACPLGKPDATSALAELGVGELADEAVSRLSGGERQRVAVARALVKSADVLIMDEPTASLDKASATLVTEVLMRVREGGATVLVASHDDLICDIGDTVVTM